MTTTTFRNLEELHLARGSKNSLESDYGGENHDDLGIFQTGNSTKHIPRNPAEKPCCDGMAWRITSGL